MSAFSGALKIALMFLLTGAAAAADLKVWTGGPPPALALKDLDGGSHRLSDYRGKVVLVNFWATWCGPCRMIAPILDQLATEYAGKVKVAKLDVDTNIKTATRFNVRSIPLLLFFKDGKVVDQIVGAVPKPHIETKLNQHAA